MQATVVELLSTKSNGNGRQRMSLVTVTKRNGTEVRYDKDKIVRAVTRCFTNSCKMPDSVETKEKATRIADQVDRLLPFEPAPVSVERIQDLVEQQLMACDYYEAAKEYILYRESHRKLREEQVDPAIIEAFKVGTSYFTGPNRHIQLFQAFDKFARFNWDAGRREVWTETVDRVINYTRGHLNRHYAGCVDEATLDILKQGLLRQEATPSMRMIQMAGPALERCQTGVYNCAFQFLREPRDMAEEMYLLCQGCGGGFSVEHQYAVDYWPRVKRQRVGAKPDTFVIPDDTEGWCDSLRLGQERWLDGHDIVYDFRLIRKKNTLLRTKGGRASGPEPLQDCLNFSRERILSRQGSRLTSLDLHDMNCFVHRISGVGGVRRASGISLSDLDDVEMRHCKDGQFWNENEQRGQANNSAVYEERPSALAFMEEWLALGKSGSGERGIFNRGALKKQFPARRKLGRYIYGCNPCGEIIQRHKQFCNLSMSIVRAMLDWAELKRRVVLAAIWGTFQSTMTDFKYIGPEWKKNCEEERLLGVDLLGHLDHPMLRPGAPGLDEHLEELKALAVQTNVEWAKRLGINPSVAVTCGKPGGDSSVFFDAAPGFKAWHGQYFLRRARTQADSPVAKLLKDQGVPYRIDYDKSGMWVFEFPCQAPEGALILGQQTAIEQLEHWKMFKLHYTEHNPSVTIYVAPEEWLSVGNWVYENWDVVGGLSFSPLMGTSHPLAPYQTLSVEEYQQRISTFPEIDWAQLTKYESEDYTTASQQPACSGDRCTI